MKAHDTVAVVEWGYGGARSTLANAFTRSGGVAGSTLANAFTRNEVVEDTDASYVRPSRTGWSTDNSLSRFEQCDPRRAWINGLMFKTC